MTSTPPWTRRPVTSALRRYNQAPDSPGVTLMMDSAQTTPSFLLERYGNPPTGRQYSFMKPFQRLLLKVDGSVHNHGSETLEKIRFCV